MSLPVIVHCICDGYGHYYPETASNLCVTTLIPLVDQIQNVGETCQLFDVGYRIFRYRDREVAELAASVLEQQLQYNIAYDSARLQRKCSTREKGCFVPLNLHYGTRDRLRDDDDLRAEKIHGLIL
eukprot:gene7952-5722_t